MVMRIGGLASGMDIDELVKKLMSAERKPLDKLFQKKTTYEWQRDAYRSVNTKLKTFDLYVSENLSTKTMNSKTATSSNSNLVSAVATGKASGTLSIEGVSQLAEAGRITSGQLNASGSTKMDSIAKGTIEFKAVNKNGEMPAESTKIVISENMTVDDFVKKVNESNAGVSAVFENGKFSFTSKNTGKEGLEIKGDTSKLTGDASGISVGKGKNAIFQVNGIATERASNSFSVNGYNVTLKGTFNESKINDSFKTAAEENFKNATDNINEAIKQVAKEYGITVDSSDPFADYEKVLAEVKKKVAGHQGTTNNAKATLDTARNIGVTSPAVDALNPNAKNFIGSLNKEQKEALAAKDLTKDNIDDIEGLSPDQLLEFRNLTDDERASIDTLSKEDLTRTAGNVYDSLSADAKSKLSGKTLDELKADTSLSEADQKLFASISSDAELDTIKDVHTKNTVYTNANAKLTKAKGFETDLISKNKEYERAETAWKEVNNSNGSSAIDTVTTDAVTLSSTTNVDDMMKTITDFVDMYNGLIKDLANQTKETKYRDYKPLSDEQKKDMSENEIKLWEEKAKSGLLRSDSLIQKGLSEMRSLVYQTNPGLSDSKFNSLFSIGITTSENYNEGGTLEINKVKLRKAIEEDPDAVERLFKNSDGKKDGSVQAKDKDGNLVFEDGKPKMVPADTRGYIEKLRFDTLKSFEISIEKKAGRSTMTDAEYSIGKGLLDTDKRIKTWEGKLKMIEARYWKQFGAMESAINKANSQSSMFMQGQ
ncbi:flagellar filament capping protein FliD [Solibacillus cecembensis]|uniref:flagellar filament capping protein FliD n=1 Tax=Solibacillus cecembensis TaxID=459347 RepID=UPI003D02207C